MSLPALLLSATIVSVLPSLVMFLVTYNKRITTERMNLMTAFAAGALIADASHHISHDTMLHSIVLFFLFDVLLSSHGHGPHNHQSHQSNSHQCESNEGLLAIMGDAIHNFTDGLAIASAASHSNYKTVLAITIHEIPHQLADFAILVKAGMSMNQILLTQFGTSLACYFGVGVGHYWALQDAGERIEGFTAGAFVYLAMTSLLPSVVKGQGTSKLAVVLAFLFGIFIINGV
jgi:zinc transporter ZupT